MADLVLVAADIKPGTDARTREVIAGETGITAGMPVYEDTADGNKWKRTDANAEASSICGGIALSAASTDQPFVVQYAGKLTINAVAAKGRAYFVSHNPGGIKPAADLSIGEYVSYLGIATSTSVIELGIQNTRITYV